MQVGEFVRKTYPITKDSSFSVEQVEINDQLFVNYRSLEAQFGDTIYRPKSRGIGPNKALAEQIKQFLRIRENVIHLNLISQVLNKWNYFEIWEGEEEKQGGEISPRRIKPSLISSCSGEQLLPEEVQKTIHSGIQMNSPIENSINYYPIWRMEGSKDDSRCRHVIHFDLLVYILSNVFVQFRKEFMSMVTIDLRSATLHGDSLEEKIEKENQFYKFEVERLTKENGGLKIENNSLKVEIRELRKSNNELQDLLRITNDNLVQANTNLDQATTELQQARVDIQTLNETNIRLNGNVEQLNHKLSTFTPATASTNSVKFSLRLYISSRHSRNERVRAKAENGRTWIGVYCGEISNFSRTIKDPRARVLVTYPVNSRDSLVYISDILGDDYIEESHYKHWLIDNQNLPEIIDQIIDVLVDHEAIIGQVELNNELLNQLIDREPEEVVEEVRNDPEEPRVQNYDFAQLSRFEYYYRRHYRQLYEDTNEHRLYFFVGSGRARVREYIQPDVLMQMVRRGI